MEKRTWKGKYYTPEKTRYRGEKTTYKTTPYGLPILGIVAIVAIIGLVWLFVGVTPTTEEAVVGEAFERVATQNFVNKDYVDRIFKDYYPKDYMISMAENAVIVKSKEPKSSCNTVCSGVGKHTIGFGFVMEKGVITNVVEAKETVEGVAKKGTVPGVVKEVYCPCV